MDTVKTGSRGARSPRVLVYMLDAVRADAMEAVNPPIWKKLKENRWAEGYRAAWSVAAEIEPYAETNSGPNHVTIATGMLLRSHHIANNDTIWSFNDAATPTWLERLGRRFPDMRTVFAFSWVPDLAMMSEHGRHSIVCGTDANNNEAVAALLRRPDPPTAVMVYDDAPDHAGHEFAFYPFSDEYLNAIETSTSRLANLLDVIRTRPSFADEEWLIVVCSDHGGAGFRHGMSGGQASTVPLLYCGKSIPAGAMPGRPGNLDIAAQILRHFGMDDEVAELDGRAELQAGPPRPARPETEGLLYDLSVVDGKPVNAAGTASATLRGEAAPAGIDAARGYVTLDALDRNTGSAFTFALEFAGTFSGVDGKQIIFGNKAVCDAAAPGFVLTAEKGVSWPLTRGRQRLSFQCGCKNAPRSYVVPNSDRMKLGDLLVGDGEPTLIAVSVDPAGTVTVFQKSGDSGYRYWFCVDAGGIRPVSSLPWNLGQDGTGRFATPAAATIGRFRFWNRPLTLDELRKL